MGVNPSTVARWKRLGKLDGLINEKGKINITRAVKELPNRTSLKHKQSAEARWKGKKKSSEVTKEEVDGYLDETIGDLAKLDIYQLQRRNELEKLLLAQIKRKRESGELVEVEVINRQGFEAGKAIKDQLSAIPDRVAPLVAAETDTFECKQLMIREIDYVLEGLHDKLKAMDV